MAHQNKTTFRSLVGDVIRRSPLRWDIQNKVSRIEVVQRAIDALEASTYLEIGVSYGECFCALSSAKKIGVDPISPSMAVLTECDKPGVYYFALTSNEFFKKRAPQVLAEGVDVVFIDGLHTYEQAYTDCINSLHYLNPRGLILLHDCLPASEYEARVAKNFEHAKTLNAGTNWNYLWVGDVWKAIVRLRAQHAHVEACVLNCDHGIGLVWQAKGNSELSLTTRQIELMSYADLTRSKNRLVGLRKPRRLMAILKMIRSARTGKSTGADVTLGSC